MQQSIKYLMFSGLIVFILSMPVQAIKAEGMELGPDCNPTTASAKTEEEKEAAKQARHDRKMEKRDQKFAHKERMAEIRAGKEKRDVDVDINVGDVGVNLGGGVQQGDCDTDSGPIH